MSWLNVFVLSVLQGLAEFLPVSSSGHLFLLQKLMNLNEGMLFFDVMLHFASGVAILILLRREVLLMFSDYKLFLKVVVATLPVVVVGLLAKDYVENWSGYIVLIGFGLLLTAFYNFMIDYFGGKTQMQKMSFWQSWWIGVLQIIAILPGVSRSGSTIVAGRVVGLEKSQALKFSFLLALPAIFGASSLELIGAIKDQNIGVVDIWQVVFGMVVCFVVSYLTIKWMLSKIKQISFKYFGYYCLALGLVVIVLSFY